MNRRINIPKFIEAVRPANPDGLTPADLQPFLLFLEVEAAQLQPLLLELKGSTWSSDKLRVIDQIQRDLTNYQERLEIYLTYINEEIAEGLAGNSDAARPVILPLFRGRYPRGHRLPDGNDDVLCSDTDLCYDSTPDVATIAILRNGLTEFDILERDQQAQFLRDVEIKTVEVFKEIATPAVFHLPELLPEVFPKDPSPYRWAAYGAIGALGLFAAYKLIK